MLKGGVIAFTGRLASMKRADAFALVAKRGGKPREKVTKITSVLIVGELGWPLEKDGQPSKSLIQAKSYGIPIISERRFLEWIGKSMPEEQAKAYSTAELAALSKLQADVIERLSTFGLVEAREGLYGRRASGCAASLSATFCTGFRLSNAIRGGTFLKFASDYRNSSVSHKDLGLCPRDRI